MITDMNSRIVQMCSQGGENKSNRPAIHFFGKGIGVWKETQQEVNVHPESDNIKTVFIGESGEEQHGIWK